MSGDKIEFYKQAISALQDPANTSAATDSIKQLGVTALATDQNFATVTAAFQNFVNEFGTQFPDLKDYLSQWDVYNLASSSCCILPALTLTLNPFSRIGPTSFRFQATMHP
jgi:hypothetical protein